MNVVIIEDEIPAQRLLRTLIDTIRPDYKIVAILDSVEDSVAWFKAHHHPDLVFMDIQLSDGISFDIFNQVDLKSSIIFTTAYDQYAIRAFKVNSIDYLLKPLKKEDLIAAIGKFEEQYYNNSKKPQLPIDYNSLMKAVTMDLVHYRERFLVKTGDTWLTLPVSDIALFYSKDKITRAVTWEGKLHFIDFTLEKLEEQLNPEYFFRANRQVVMHINALKKITIIGNGKLRIDTHPHLKEAIYISKEKAARFKEWVDR